MRAMKQRLITLAQLLFCNKVNITSSAAAMLFNARLDNVQKHAPQSGRNDGTVMQQILQHLNSILVAFKIILVQCAYNLQARNVT